MTTLRDMIEVMEAAEQGKVIQIKSKRVSIQNWRTIEEPDWNWRDYKYRVKKEPREWYICTYPATGETRRWHCNQKDQAIKHAKLWNEELIHVREVLED